MINEKEIALSLLHCFRFTFLELKNDKLLIVDLNYVAVGLNKTLPQTKRLFGIFHVCESEYIR